MDIQSIIDTVNEHACGLYQVPSAKELEKAVERIQKDVELVTESIDIISPEVHKWRRVDWQTLRKNMKTLRALSKDLPNWWKQLNGEKDEDKEWWEE